MELNENIRFLEIFSLTDFIYFTTTTTVRFLQKLRLNYILIQNVWIGRDNKKATQEFFAHYFVF
jgi:hypothetical protein